MKIKVETIAIETIGLREDIKTYIEKLNVIDSKILIKKDMAILVVIYNGE